MSNEDLALLGGHPVRTRPWPKWPAADDSTIGAVTDVLRSSRWAVSGPYDGRTCYERRFATAFAKFHGVAFCTPTTSGTAALTIALQAIGVGPGDEVLVPGLTWVACASSVVNLGAEPVLVDCDPVTLAMSVDAARAACTHRTAAVMLVHPFSSVADLDAFGALAEERGIALVEDCSQAHGARWRGRPVGTLGDAGCFSMQQSKLLTAGEGGAVVTDDADLGDRLEQLRCDGRRFTDMPEIGRLELVEVGSVLGRNLCLSELQAAVLVDRLEHLDAENERRADRVEHLESLLAGVHGVSLIPRDERVTTPTFYNYVLRLDLDAFAGVDVDTVARAVAAELGTMVNPLYVPLSHHTLLRAARMAERDLPVAEEARRTCISLTHPVLLAEREAMGDIATAIAKVRDGAGALGRLDSPADRLSF